MAAHLPERYGCSAAESSQLALDAIRGMSGLTHHAADGPAHCTPRITHDTGMRHGESSEVSHRIRGVPNTEGHAGAYPHRLAHCCLLG
jgi:hypothetical protein